MSGGRGQRRSGTVHDIFRADDVRFDIAVRIAGPLWRAGCWARGAALAGGWLMLLTTSPRQALPGAAALTVATLALGLAFVHTSPAALDVLARVPGAGWLADHLSSTGGRATLDASGLGEGLGAFLMAWVFVGPRPVTGLPLPARIAGLALSQCYVWDAILQAMIDPSWYNRRLPPGTVMRWLRWAMPAMLVGVGIATSGPWSPEAREIPGPVRYVLACAPLLYYPITATVDLVLRAVGEQVRTAVDHWRDDIASDLHSAVKNPLTLLQTHLGQPDPPLEESRSLVREARIAIEDLRRQLQTRLDDVAAAGVRPFEELWLTIQRILPASERARCTLSPDAWSVPLNSADRQLLQRVLADLLTNALTHGGGQVSVDLRLVPEPGSPRRRLCLRVDDDGPGVSPRVLTEDRSSLRLLRDRLARLGGTLEVGEPPGGHVAVSWPAHSGGAITWVPSPAAHRDVDALGDAPGGPQLSGAGGRASEGTAWQPGPRRG